MCDFLCSSNQRFPHRTRFSVRKQMMEAVISAGIFQKVDPAFEQVVRIRETQVLRTAYRILGNWADAEDVAQEVFVKLHRHGLNFPAEAALGSWLYRVTTNQCLDRARQPKRSQLLLDSQAHGGPSVEMLAIREQARQRLMTALESLPAKERAAVVLREIEGLSTEEVASILGSTPVTVRSQISRAMDHLRKLMAKEAK